MPRDLFTSSGERKYLTEEELDGFLAEANKQERSEVRSFCLVLAHTGCRINVRLTEAEFGSEIVRILRPRKLILK